MPNTDKTILLPQLQRYDQKIKGWADNKFLTKVDTLSLPKATATTLGGVKVGGGLNVTSDGTLSNNIFIVSCDLNTSSATFEQINAAFTYGMTVLAVFGNGSVGRVSRIRNDLYTAYVNTSISSKTIKSPSGNYEVPSDAHSQYVLWDKTNGYSVYSYNMFWDIGTTLEYLKNGSYGKLDVKDGGITSAKLASGAVTADKIANGAITADKLASGVGGGSKVFNIKYSNVLNTTIWVPFDNTYIMCKFEGYTHGTLVSGVFSIVYKQFDFGDFDGYLFEFIVPNPFTTLSSPSEYLHVYLDLTNNNSHNSSALTKTGTTNTTPSFFKSTKDYVYIAAYSRMEAYENTVTQLHPDVNGFKMVFVPKSTSARAALATLLPVQDECEQMEAEVAKLEQDWIDNQDETVAVDGNGVPITIASKKTELEKKKKELEKLREDYFSKLGDWKNEVQE